MSLKVVFATSEVVPFAKTGGLADVSGALPNYLKKKDVDISVFMPNYGSIKHFDFKIELVEGMKNIPIRLGGIVTTYSVFKGKIPNTDVDVYLIDNPYYYHRGKVYTQDSDEDERFILFQRAILETVQRLQWEVDIFHCNDWQTALIPIYLKTTYKWDKIFENTKSLLSIHNMAYQGVFGSESFFKLNLDSSLMLKDGDLEYYGNVNFLKGGILYADAVSTVSPTYANEIQTPEYGCQLDSILRRRAGRVSGILNGVDYDIWSPEKDELIPFNFDKIDLSGKVECKKYILEQADLDYNPNVPVLGIVSRLTSQKGLKLISEIIFDLMELDIRILILGSGEKALEDFFRKSANTFPHKIAFHTGFNNELAHLIEAGSDMFLMPSSYEPCGLNQIYSLKYGTIPIVRKTGGLADTVQQFNPNSGEGNGFVFEEFSSHQLYWTIRFALKTYENLGLWSKIVQNAMTADFSWEKSAEEYLNLYKTMQMFY